MTNKTPLDEFIILCPFVTGIDVQKDYVNYKNADRYSLKVAKKIIIEHSLPLNASLVGTFKNVLHITQNK